MQQRLNMDSLGEPAWFEPVGVYKMISENATGYTASTLVYIGNSAPVSSVEQIEGTDVGSCDALTSSWRPDNADLLIPVKVIYRNTTVAQGFDYQLVTGLRPEVNQDPDGGASGYFSDGFDDSTTFGALYDPDTQSFHCSEAGSFGSGGVELLGAKYHVDSGGSVVHNGYVFFQGAINPDGSTRAAARRIDVMTLMQADGGGPAEVTTWTGPVSGVPAESEPGLIELRMGGS
ncbi:MAG: hypothetical protein L0K86_01090 [Actinomycetia bacterium]|nr:hypothetical protein [Actinomycetes bacterium]